MSTHEESVWRSVDTDREHIPAMDERRRSLHFDQLRHSPSPMIVLPDEALGDISSALNDIQIDSKTSAEPDGGESAQFQPLQYHHQANLGDASVPPVERGRSPPASTSPRQATRSHEQPGLLSPPSSRPNSTVPPGSKQDSRERRDSPGHNAHLHVQGSSNPRRYSPEPRGFRHSPVDLQMLPYAQQAAPKITFSQDGLRAAIGNNVALLSRNKTLEMYRSNVRKTNEPEVQYSFAVFLVETAQILLRDPSITDEQGLQKQNHTVEELFAEARSILQRLSDRSYPFAQYYLADGLANGTLNRGKEDDARALPLFVTASKHGHAESAYRAALCYEHGWGTAKSPPKSTQYLRFAAAKNHPGAMFRLAKACLTGDLGQEIKYREGVKWLKRAAESADAQYNVAPFELGVLHEAGYGDDVFKDEAYAAQLFTQSADLGHAEACFRLGDAYEHGKVSCPKDPSLSVHFYHMGAQRGHTGAMLAICAWYMVGAPPVLEKDEDEAYEWAKKAAGAGLSKAQYTMGFFTEIGIGCRRDPLEANVWYVRAAEQGDARAKTRLAAIQAVYSGKPVARPASPAREPSPWTDSPSSKGNERKGLVEKDKKRWKIF